MRGRTPPLRRPGVPSQPPGPGTRPRHPPFVGRRWPLAQCAHILDTVRLGQPAVLCLQGEAGIGKTRLLGEVERLAQQRGFRTYQGRSYEDVAAPYGPIIALLQQMQSPLATAQLALPQADQERLAALRQGVIPVPSGAQTPLSAESEQHKLGLGLAIARALIGVAQAQPLLLIFDDLHWADASSLDALTVLIFALVDQARLGALPLCLVAATRPVPSTTRLAHLLARCERETLCQWIDLPPLEETELAALLQGLGVTQPAPRLLHTFTEVTGGSPLFIQELCHYLAQRQALVRHQGQVDTTLPAADLRLPTEVTAALLERTAPLSPESRTTLHLAALLGETWTLPILSAARGLADDVLLAHLDEAVQMGLLVSEGQQFQFVHALLRQALYHQRNVAWRQQQHGHIAQCLLCLYGLALTASQCLEVAHHLLCAGSLADPVAFMRYVRQAGDYALELCEWSYAAQAYTAVLDTAMAQASLATPDLAALAYRAGLAHARDGEVLRSDAYHDQAAVLYRQAGDLHGVAQALIAKTLRQAAVAYGTLVDTQGLERLLEEAGADDQALRGRIAVALAEVYTIGGQYPQAKTMARHGLELGQQHGDARLCARACFDAGLAEAQDLHPQAALAHYVQGRGYAQQAQDVYMDGWIVQRTSIALQQVGRFDAVRATAGEAYDLAVATHNWRDYTLTLAALTAVEADLGAFDTAERYAQETLEYVSRYRATFGGLFMPYELAWLHTVRGAWPAAEAALALYGQADSSFAQVDSFFHTCAEVYRHVMWTYMPEGAPPGTPTASWEQLPLPTACDYRSLPLCCALVELSAAHARPTRAAQLYRLIAPAVTRGVLCTRGWHFLTPRILGLAASLTQQWERAETHFQAALTVAMDIGAQPEHARTCLDYATMLSARDAPHDQERAIELACKARLELHALGMRPGVQRAEQLLARWQRVPYAEPSRPLGAAPRYSPVEIDILSRMSQDDTFFLG